MSTPILAPGLVNDEVRERFTLVAFYANAAASLAACKDTAAMAHSLGCAVRDILAAVEAAETLRPVSAGGGR